MHSASPAGHLGYRVVSAAYVIALLGAGPLLLAQKPPATAPVPAAAFAASSTLDRIRAAGRIRLGYRADARPFSYDGERGQPRGYSVALCERVADAAGRELGLDTLPVDWVAVTTDNRFDAVREGRVDVLCGADTVTLARRAEVSFSIPIFAGGLGVAVRADAPARLREVLSGRGETVRPVWRASASRVLQSRAFSAAAGTTTEHWIHERLTELRVIAQVLLVDNYDAGLRGLLDRRSDAFFGERAVLLDAARRHPGARDLAVIDRQFTYEPLALAVALGDERFRLLVDGTLSRFYASGELGALYTQWFGEPDGSALTFFHWNTLPE